MSNTISKKELAEIMKTLLIQVYRSGKNSKYRGYLTGKMAEKHLKFEIHSVESLINNYEII